MSQENLLEEPMLGRAGSGETPHGALSLVEGSQEGSGNCRASHGVAAAAGGWEMEG